MQAKSIYTYLSFGVILFHLIGVIGIAIPYTRDLVISLTPINLIISLAALLYGSNSQPYRLIRIFIPVFLIGLIIEIIGIQTGFPFGSYTYGSPLGPKIFDTPILIGVNWFMLSYLFYFITQIIKSPILRILISSSLMTVMDYLIEPIAIKLDYWSWLGNSIPFSNYFAWFVISVVIQIIFEFMLTKENNKVAIPLLLAQVGFFCLLYFPDF